LRDASDDWLPKLSHNTALTYLCFGEDSTVSEERSQAYLPSSTFPQLYLNNPTAPAIGHAIINRFNALFGRISSDNILVDCQISTLQKLSFYFFHLCVFVENMYLK
jgi:hypothetical protein